MHMAAGNGQYSQNATITIGRQTKRRDTYPVHLATNFYSCSLLRTGKDRLPWRLVSACRTRVCDEGLIFEERDDDEAGIAMSGQEHERRGSEEAYGSLEPLRSFARRLVQLKT